MALNKAALAARCLGITFGIAALYLCAGCLFSQQLDEQAYREYHASRMRSVATALWTRDFAPQWPDSPPTPLTCREQTERTYRQLVATGLKQDAAWQALMVQTGNTLDLLDREVTALVGRDVPRIKRLAPELLEHSAKLQSLQDTHSSCQLELEAQLQALRAAWTRVWPEQDLEFDLRRELRAVQSGLQGTVPAGEQPGLLHYHDSVYTRLAMTYLGLQPGVEPDPEPRLPMGAAGVERALQRLEDALRTRYDLEQAIALDVAELDEIAGAGLFPKDWREHPPDPVAIGKQRAGAGLARLKLLKLCAALQEICQAVLQQEAEWQWRQAWPGMTVESDIMVFANLAPVPPAGQAGYSSFTFRD